MSKSVKLQDDFYRYVNSNWLENNPIPDKYSRWGTFEALHEENLNKIKDLIENKASGEFEIINKLYTEFMNKNKIKSLNSKPIKKYIDMVNKCKSKDELWILMSQLNKYGIASFFAFEPEIDAKNSNLVALYLSAGGLSLPERGYYFDEDKEETRTKYKNYILKIT